MIPCGGPNQRTLGQNALRGPLTSHEIHALAEAPAVGVLAEQRCADNKAFADTQWRDAFGHPCSWYSTPPELLALLRFVRSDAAGACVIGLWAW